MITIKATKATILPIIVIIGLLTTAAQANQELSSSRELHQDDPSQTNVNYDVRKFFQFVQKFTQSPPSKPELVTTCEANIDDQYVTFIGMRKEKTFIVALTKHRLINPSQDISLETLYGLKRGLPHYFGYNPNSKTATPNWAYVFDRNRDGKIDYLTYLESPMPVWPEEHEGSQPVIIGRIKGTVYKIALRNIKMVFWHMSDDNFDGRHDGLIVPMRNNKTGWKDSWLLAQDRNFDGEYEHCSYFDKTFLQEPLACTTLDNKYRVSGKSLLGLKEVPPESNTLNRINKGAIKCNFRASSFYHTVDAIRQDLNFGK